MSWLEIVAVGFSVACVVLSIYKNVWTWLVGIVGIVAYFYLFYTAKLYGDMSLQIIYLGQSVYGLWFWQLKPIWAKNTVLDNDLSGNFIPQTLTKLGLIYTLLGLVFCFGLSAYLLTWTNADLPYLDAAASSISLIANWLLARKVLENWLLWIVADALLIYIFINKSLYLSAATYFLFLILAIFAFIKWQNSIKKGLVFGKFMPFHKGHEFLIQTAANQCDEVYVLVCSVPSEPIAGELRYAAVKRTFPTLKVLHVTDKNPSYPHEHSFFWEIWLHTFQRNAPDVEVVFSSESYGDELAARMNIAHICVDKLRINFPVSGTALRQNLMQFWEFLPAASRVFLCPKVALLGAESVGKSYLAQKLAVYFNSTFVAEYGREYVDKFGHNLSPLDLSHIAAGQLYREDEAASQANRILFCDTELLTTQIWAEIYCGSCPDWIIQHAHSRKYELFLLLDSDIDWVDDGTRLYPNIRQAQTARILAELKSRNLPYILIKGDFETREKLAVEAVKNHFSFL